MAVEISALSQAEYTMAIEYDGSNNPIYVGEAKPGTSQSAIGWRIKQVTFDASNNATDVKWAGSSTEFKFTWDDRSSYTYG